MRQTHLGGDKLFVDYAGHKACYTDPLTGKQVDCELLVATLLGPWSTLSYPRPRKI